MMDGAHEAGDAMTTENGQVAWPDAPAIRPCVSPSEQGDGQSTSRHRSVVRKTTHGLPETGTVLPAVAVLHM